MHARAGKGLLALAVLGAALGARAQVGEHGRITTRSDVKMALEGAPGTTGKKLDALAQTLGAPLAGMKRCYAEVVQEHPSAVGTVVVELQLPTTGKPAVRVPELEPVLKPARACVDQAFAKLDTSAVPRPAGARVTLTLTNTAAASVEEVKRSGESAAQVDIEEAEGTFRAKGQSLQGEVSFAIRSRERAAVEQAYKVVRDALPGLFDCRRRASKKTSPEGEIVLRLEPRGVITSLSSSVPNERAPMCVIAALKRARGALKPVADLTIRFAARAP